MPPDANGSFDGHEIVEVVGDGEPGTPSGTMRLMDFIPIDIYIPSVEKGALSRSRRKRRFLDFLRAHPSKDWFLRSTFVGRLRRRSHHDHDQASADSDDGGGSGGRRRRFRVPFVRKIKWGKLWTYAVSWCRKPENFAMIIWLVFVAAGLLSAALHAHDGHARRRHPRRRAAQEVDGGDQPDPQRSLHHHVPVPAPQDLPPPGAAPPVAPRRRQRGDQEGVLQGRRRAPARPGAHARRGGLAGSFCSESV